LQARGPGSWFQKPQDCAPLPEVAAGSPSAAMNCGSMRLNFERSPPDAAAANMRNPTDSRERLTDGARSWIMRLLQLDDLILHQHAPRSWPVRAFTEVF